MTSVGGTSRDVVAPFSIDLATGEVHWSPTLYHLYGLCPDTDQPTVETLLAAIVPEDRDRVSDEFTEAIREGGTFSIRYGLRGPDGKRHDILLTAVGSRLNGVTRYVSGFLIDVTAPLTSRLDAAVAASAANRATIEQAKGALMLAYAVTEQEAFDILRRYSNQHNVRLAEVAQGIVQALNKAALGDPIARQAVTAVFTDLVDAVKRQRATSPPAAAASSEARSPRAPATDDPRPRSGARSSSDRARGRARAAGNDEDWRSRPPSVG